jgi:hypothetical protein
MPEDEIPKEVLNRRWLHSHEEDSGGEMVYRPANYDFPPSRGRTGFELRPDGSAAVLGPAPTDAPQEHSGTWKIDATKRLVVHVPELQQTQSMTIVSSDPDRLVVRR